MTNQNNRGWQRRTFIKLILAAGAGLAASTIYAKETDNKMLIIYFSHSGHTKTVAEEIQTLTKAAIAEIKPVTPYPKNYDELVNFAENQAAQNTRPPFSCNLPPDLGQYNVIFLGFPIWAYTMPMLVYSFLDKYHFPGKRIAPFSTHMGSGLADAPEQIARLCPQATILPGLAIRGTDSANSQARVKKWLLDLGLLN